MLRVLGVGLLALLLLTTGPTEHDRLTKKQYIAAVEYAINGLPRYDQGLLPGQIEHVAGRLERLDPPAEVAEIHADWISSLRDCAVRFRKLDRSFPEGAIIVVREMKPCFDAHRKICDRLYAKGYSFG